MYYLFLKTKNELRKFLKEEDGAGVIELVLIIVVLIGFVLLFKDKIGSLLNTVFTKINGQAEGIYQ